MIPNPNWFPTNMAARADWYVNFNKQFTILAADLGFTPADVAWVNDDNQVMQFLAAVAVEMEAFTEAVRQYRIIISEQKIGDITPDFPAMPNLTLPVVVATGMFERLALLVDRIRLSAAFTLEIGAMLDINPKKPVPPDPNTLKPTIRISLTYENYKFDAIVPRLKMSGFQVQIRRMESEVWTNIGFGTSSPLQVTVQPTTQGQPERLQVRAILYKNNEPVGQPSDPVYVVVIP